MLPISIFLQLLMLSHSNAVQSAQGSQVSVFPDGKLPVYSTLLKVTEGIHFIAKPKSIISCIPCVHDQLTTADEVAKKKRQMERQTDRQMRTQKERLTERERCCFSKFSSFSRLLHSDIFYFANRKFLDIIASLHEFLS